MHFFYMLLALICVSPAALAQSAAAVSPGKSAPAATAAAQDTPTPVFACPTLTGRILDHNNKGLVGATVAIKGTYEVFTTNSEGSYVINIPVTGAQVLQVSAGGYTEKEIRLQDCNSVTVSLELLPTTRLKQRGKLKGTIKKTGAMKIPKP